MRARLLNAWPDLSHYFGIHPWDVERLSYVEIDSYVEALNEIARTQRKHRANTRGRRGR